MDRNEIGRRLETLRGDRTQAEVAEALGISQSAIAMYETGVRIPRDEIKVKLAEYFGVPVQDIFFADADNSSL